MSTINQEKLQQLFEAALRDSSPIIGPPKRAVPQGPATPPTQEPAQSDRPATKSASEPEPEEPATPVFDKAEAEELGKLLDEQIRRQAHRRRLESIVTAVVLIGSVSGFTGWFVSSPVRTQALASALAEIRSVGDINALVASYQKSLDRIAVRSQHMDEASISMGITNPGEVSGDLHMDAEMKELMGGEGKTIGDRAKAMDQAFGKMREKHGVSAPGKLQDIAASTKGFSEFDH